ncbi:twin-arginine translocase subunit TatC [Denitrobaculum tricleocarpae]|uniref:Sec-independent protein translocase protein TatC n=2 Tax=Denitrobaculum tricleocarpae TaxID=2591009 RepID=A0A545TQC1_9PROT|nr:twin-arginine translocase subunit TatC [Denitrobaculum tricleocarpae]TQV79408.1 twin-arginine translocase subunit TatC [Denitrobaculum tricleocarpae]
MPLLDHLIELRKRLLICVVLLLVAFLLCFAFAENIFEFLTQPLADVLKAQESSGQVRRLIFTDLTEVFFTYVKVAFFAGAFLCVPVFLTQIWLFIAPGLYENEKTAIAPFLIATPILFFIGGALVYYVIFPVASEFFISFEKTATEGTLAIELETKVDQYLSLIMKLIFAFGICFELPVLMTLMARVGIATSAGMAAKRKYAIVGVFIVAAIFTPPDPISQLLLAIPIILLYEVSILLARLVEKKRAEQEASEDSDGSA